MTENTHSTKALQKDTYNYLRSQYAAKPSYNLGNDYHSSISTSEIF